MKQTLITLFGAGTLLALPTQAATIAQLDFEMSGTATGQSTQAGWTSVAFAATGGGATVTTTAGGVGFTLTANEGASGGTAASFNARGGTNQNRSTTISGTSWNDAVEDFIAARDGDGTVTLDLTGLNLALTYTLTLWHNDSSTTANNWGFAAGINNTSGYSITPSMQIGTLVGVADAGFTTNWKQTDSVTDSSFDRSVISFTSDSSGNARILLTGNSASNFVVISDLQLDAVPEPSVALLGGLGVFALLRRRRD